MSKAIKVMKLTRVIAYTRSAQCHKMRFAKTVKTTYLLICQLSIWNRFSKFDTDPSLTFLNKKAVCE